MSRAGTAKSSTIEKTRGALDFPAALITIAPTPADVARRQSGGEKWRRLQLSNVVMKTRFT